MQEFDKSECNILYVDDEPANLKVFQAAFRRDYNIFTASNGDEGMRIVQEHDIQVIVTDQRMPGMTGVQFLQHLADEPDNIRMILTGYSDMENIVEAINTGKVYKYITKPWDKNELKITLDNALETVMLRRHNKQMIQELQDYSKGLEEKVRQRTAEIEQQKNLQLQQQLEFAQKEKEAAETSARHRHQFMANMSHEIRTPMNAILGMTRLLLAQNPRPEQLRYLNPIRLSANNLLVIINDILDLSKIEAGKIVIERTCFQLKEIIDCLHDMLASRAEEKGLELKVSTDPALPAILNGDPTRLNQILVNLTGNAIKFTNQGHVAVSAKLIKKEDSTIWIRFDVTDTGIGIGPEYIDTVFDRFTQAGADVARKFGGTGLGLAISRQLAELMGGTIAVSSTLNVGTTFTVTIPFEEATPEEAAQQDCQPAEATIGRLARLRVLLVEDNEFNRIVAEDTLTELIPGITIASAVNGQDALDQLQKQAYDMVLMDIQMPVMDGVTATKLIRQMPAPACHVKIIAMTANVLQEDVRQYLDAGMDAYVSKPFNTEELLHKMNTLAGDNAGNSQPDGAAQQPQPTPLPDQVTEMRFLEQFTSGNKDKQQKYISMFLDNAPKLLDGITRAQAAGDYAALKMSAHSLKPQMSYMGIKEEVSNIYQLEQAAGDATRHTAIPALVTNLERVCKKAFEELNHGF